MASVRVVIQKPVNSSGSGVQSVNGDGVNNADPLNPVLAFPNGTDVLLVNEGVVTVTEAVVDLQSTKADLELIKSNVYESNTITFTNVIGDYFGTKTTPRTGTLSFDDTNAVTGGISVVNYNNPTDDYPKTSIITTGDFIPNVLNKLYIERDSEGFTYMNITNNPIPPTQKYAINFTKANKMWLQGTTYLGGTPSVGDYIELEIMIGEATFTDSYTLLMGVATSNFVWFRFSANDLILLRSSTTETINVSPVIPIDEWLTVRLQKEVSGYTMSIGGNDYAVADSAVEGFSQFGAGYMQDGGDSTQTRERFEGKIRKIVFSGDVLEFTNTTGNHETVDGDSFTLKNQVGLDISTVYEAI